MEKQKLGSTQNEAPTLKMAYLEPKLSLISFKPEEGFAKSEPAAGVSITPTSCETDATLWK